MRPEEGTTAGSDTERIEKEYRQEGQLGVGTGDKGTKTNENCSEAWVSMASGKCGGQGRPEEGKGEQETELEEIKSNKEREETRQDRGVRRKEEKTSPYKKWWDGRRRNLAVATMIVEWATEGTTGGGERNQVQCC
jgi:hypothetical protein